MVNRKTQKTAQAVKPERVSKMDQCQTPPYAIDPLVDWIRYAGGTTTRIWDPAAGQGLLTRALRESGFGTYSTDLADGYNFLECEAPAGVGLIVTNPPYSIKYKFLAHCLDLNLPFALLVPVEALGAAAAQELMKNTGCQVILMDHRINFKMPNKGWAGSAWFPTCWITWVPWYTGSTKIEYAHVQPWTAEEVIAWELNK